MPSAHRKRLTAMADELGLCQTHWEALICTDCDAAPMPGCLRESIDGIMDGVIARLTPHEICLAMSRVTPPASAPCSRCGGLRTCLACVEPYAKRLFREIGLTPAEDAALKALTRKVRACDRGTT